MSGGIARRPRAIVVAGGQRIAPMNVEVTVSSHQSADHFHAQIPISVLPDGVGLDWWIATTPIPCSVEISNDIGSGALVEMISGTVDEVEVDFAQNLLTITGRDKTGELIDAKTNEKWLNHSVSDIIKEVAGRHGLSVEISAALKAGKIYVDDYASLSDLDTEWNVVVRLAKRLGATTYVKGTTLYVKKVEDKDGGVFELIYSPPSPAAAARGNFLTLTAHRSVHLGKTLKVKAKSWRQKEKKQEESEWELPGKGGTITHEYRGANITKEQADAMASSQLDHAASHERTIHFNAPGDTGIDPRMILRLSGTGTALDQDYLIGEIEHRVSSDEGYRMNVSSRAKDAKRKKKKTK